MPIQTEKKLTPLVTPESPKTKDDLLKWAQDLNQSFQRIQKDIQTQFNLHISGAYAHPSSWANWRLTRPPYRYSTVDVVRMPIPALFKIGDNLLQSTSDLTCNIGGTGPGGLDTGTRAASTLYYLYAINNGGSPALMASVNDPTVGPTGYSDWTYIGGFVTNGSSNVQQFSSCDGMVIFGGAAQNQNVKNTTPQQMTLRCPIGARFAWMIADWATTGALNVIYIQALFSASASNVSLYSRFGAIEEDLLG